MNIIHGDMKGVSRLNNMLISPQALILSCSLQDNVLVSDDGQPRLCDFGISRMLSEETMWVTPATSAPGTVQYMAPELLDGTQVTVTKESDIYAFASTVVVRPRID